MLLHTCPVVAWPGMPLPPLRVDGRYLKDPCGNKVLLHGVAITPHPWFNGCQYGFSSPYCTWDNYDVEGALRYNYAVMGALTDTTAGYFLNYIRLHVDPYWTNEPGPPIPEDDISRFRYERLVLYTNEVIIPLVNYARLRGMYVILRPPGVCPHRIAVGDAYHQYLQTVWNFLSQHSGLKNADHVMFELANEPVQILGTDGTWGTVQPAHFAALKNFFQPIVNLIRNNGADNILWIPGTGWQSHYAGYVDFPIEGGNIGYAVHVYPGYWGGVRNYEALKRGWEEHVKPVADIAPIAVTETDWAQEGYGAFGIANTGVAGGEGFGANLNYIFRQSGNVSWNLLAPDNFLHMGDPNGGVAYDNNWEACAAPVKFWFAENARSNTSKVVCERDVALENFGIYEIAFQVVPRKVLGLAIGTDIEGVTLAPQHSNGGLGQRWLAMELGNNQWRFVSLRSDARRSITMPEGQNQALMLAYTRQADAQIWKVEQLENGAYKISPVADATKSWSIDQCAMEGTENLKLADFSNITCQQFRFNLIGRETEVITSLPEPPNRQPRWQVYPNPSATGRLILYHPELEGVPQGCQVAIYNAGGQMVYYRQISSGAETELETGLGKGFYLLKISSGHQVKVEKIIIQ
jgi:hypothetical protein